MTERRWMTERRRKIPVGQILNTAAIWISTRCLLSLASRPYLRLGSHAFPRRRGESHRGDAMTRLAVRSAYLAVLVSLLPAAPALALNQVSFMSAAGSGTACTLAAPCVSFQAAHDRNRTVRRIVCLDGGLFANAILTKSITIDCAGTAASVGQLTVDGSSISVTIRNLTIFRLRRRHRFSRWRRPGRRELHSSGTRQGPGISFKPSLPNSRFGGHRHDLQRQWQRFEWRRHHRAAAGLGGAKVTLDRVQVNANVTASS